MKIRLEKGLKKENAIHLCHWSNEKGEAFQEQWMGSNLAYPLNTEKVLELSELFSIFCGEEFVEVVQQIRRENGNVHIGRFLINPKRNGLGFGKQAMESFVELIFKEEHIMSISLTVFAWNQRAKKLYEDLGFQIEKVIEYPNLKFIMKKYR